MLPVRALLPDGAGHRLEVVDDVEVGVEDVHPLVVGHRERERSVERDRHHELDALAVGDRLVLLTERACGVDQPGALAGGDEVGLDDAERLGVPLEVGHRRGVGATHQVAAGQPLDDLVLELPVVVLELLGVRREPLGADDVALRLAGEGRLDHDVLDVGVDHDREVGGEGPRGRGPDEGDLAGLQPAADGHRRVLAGLVDVVVHPQLVVGQGRLVVPAVGQDPEPLVHETLLVELLERPDDRLHVVEVEGLVVVLEVDPAGLAGDVVAPLVGVGEDRRPAGVVEDVDAHLDDLVGGLDALEAHRLELGGQAVGVPAEAALDAAPAHGAVARDQVLDVAGQQVAVVGQAVGERRSVVEDELVVAVLARLPLLDARLEGPVGLPVREHLLLDRRERRRRGHSCGVGVGDLRVGLLLMLVAPARPRCVHEDDPVAAGTAVPPRLPPPPPGRRPLRSRL